MDLGVRGRVYLVTGGSRGLGLATARALVDEGALVIVAARDRDEVDAACGQFGTAASPCVLDLADDGAARAAVDAVLERHGRIDGALVSVGGPPIGSVLLTSDADWRASFESVFLGALRVSRAVIDGILVSGSDAGSLAWVLSTSARETITGLSISNGLRPGLAMLVTDLADEIGPKGVRVNGLLPGRIATDRVAALDAASGDAPAARARATARIPLGRYGTPEEFAAVAAFVLSPAAAFVTGSLLTVDGGATRH